MAICRLCYGIGGIKTIEITLRHILDFVFHNVCDIVPRKNLKINESTNVRLSELENYIKRMRASGGFERQFAVCICTIKLIKIEFRIINISCCELNSEALA